MQHAWDGYRRYAWGADELRPISKGGRKNPAFGEGKMTTGAGIVDSLTVLHLMAMEEEFGMARDWVGENLSFSGLVSRHIPDQLELPGLAFSRPKNKFGLF